jgi:hypothetical protein
VRKTLALVLALIGLWAALYIWGHYTEAGRMDYCLDEGGTWSHEQGQCEGARLSYRN